MAHSRIIGVRSPDPKRTLDMCLPKVRIGYRLCENVLIW